MEGLKSLDTDSDAMMGFRRSNDLVCSDLVERHEGTFRRLLPVESLGVTASLACVLKEDFRGPDAIYTVCMATYPNDLR